MLKINISATTKEANAATMLVDIVKEKERKSEEGIRRQRRDAVHNWLDTFESLDVLEIPESELAAALSVKTPSTAINLVVRDLRERGRAVYVGRKAHKGEMRQLLTWKSVLRCHDNLTPVTRDVEIASEMAIFDHDFANFDDARNSRRLRGIIALFPKSMQIHVFGRPDLPLPEEPEETEEPENS